jgi:hypothetical protein
VVNSSELQDVQSQYARTDVRHLVDLAARGLPQMFDESTGMFCNKLKKSAGGLVPEGVSPRYTAMTLMGLHRLEQNGLQSPLGVRPAVERFLAHTNWVDNIGDLGLMLWLGARVAPDLIGELERHFQIPTALERFETTREGNTMHLSWFLTGLSCLAPVSNHPDAVRDVARKTYHLLMQNQGKHGYFGHLAAQRSLRGRLRGQIGSFADQVYPIYGMTQFFQAFGDESALSSARDCALAICQAQGPLGQWWWHYHSGNERVFEEYPVYSVHQHGMAPMALFALSKASGESFDSWIYKGLGWLDKRNELSVNMVDSSANVIWRCIRPSMLKRFSGALRGAGRKVQDPAGLSVLFECWPYELGWLLYGLADLLSKPVSLARPVAATSSVV